MKLIEVISKHSNIFNTFIQFIGISKVNINDYLTRSDWDQLGLVLQFLEIYGIGVLVDKYCFVVQFLDLDKDEVIQYIKLHKKHYIISKFSDSVDEKKDSCMANYIEAIDAAFKHLEQPF